MAAIIRSNLLSVDWCIVSVDLIKDAYDPFLGQVDVQLPEKPWKLVQGQDSVPVGVCSRKLLLQVLLVFLLDFNVLGGADDAVDGPDPAVCHMGVVGHQVEGALAWSAEATVGVIVVKDKGEAILGAYAIGGYFQAVILSMRMGCSDAVSCMHHKRAY